MKTSLHRLSRQIHRVPRRHRQLALAELILAGVFLIFALYSTMISRIVSEKWIFGLMSVALLVIFLSYLFSFIDTFFEHRAERHG